MLHPALEGKRSAKSDCASKRVASAAPSTPPGEVLPHAGNQYMCGQSSSDLTMRLSLQKIRSRIKPRDPRHVDARRNSRTEPNRDPAGTIVIVAASPESW